MLIETVKKEMASCFDRQLQLQIEFKQSSKLCLNLCSAKWFKPNLILVSNFKPSKFWEKEIIVADWDSMGRVKLETNCRDF